MGDNNMEIPVETVDKASKWTVFVLVDLKILFIITFVYVTIVNLISTTANNEASTAVRSNNTFTVTIEHTNVNVSAIDDAVLWNCRDHSETKRYYKVLYSMLIGFLGFALAAFTIVKWNVLYSAVHGRSYLWHIAIVQSIQKKAADEKNASKADPEDDEAATTLAKIKAKIYRTLLENECKVTISKELNFYRLLTLFINSCIIPLGLFLIFTTYDLHPLSCISEGEEFIRYTMATNDTGGIVEIQFPNSIKNYQKVANGLLYILVCIFAVNITRFYKYNFKIIEEYEIEVENQYKRIDESLPQEQREE